MSLHRGCVLVNFGTLGVSVCKLVTPCPPARAPLHHLRPLVFPRPPATRHLPAGPDVRPQAALPAHREAAGHPPAEVTPYHLAGSYHSCQDPLGPVPPRAPLGADQPGPRHSVQLGQVHRLQVRHRAGRTSDHHVNELS